MHHANHFYGHAHIMARYASLAEVPRIWGYLQHGWNLHDGFAVGTAFTPGFPKFVWSDAPRRRGWVLGTRDYLVVGSPWAYLLELEKQSDWEAAERPREGTIAYPFHGWEGQHLIGSHDKYVAEMKATEEGPITVCLYWNEYRNPEIRRSYERAGLRVVSHGYRGNMWRGTDINFLYRQLAELRAHRRVVSNRMGSALLYGASVGCEVGIYGDPMILEAERVEYGGMERQKRLYPEFHRAHVPVDYVTDMARVELGLDQLLSPPEIIDAFGWQNATRVKGDVRPLESEGELSFDPTLGEPAGEESMPIA